MKKIFGGIKNFFKGVFKEARRVRWPSIKEMSESTVTVVIFTAFFALFLFFSTNILVKELLQIINYFPAVVSSGA